MALFDEDLFSGVAITAKAASRAKKKRKKSDEPSLNDLPPLTQEQEDSLLSKALGGGVSGLQWLGEAIDKPRRAVYGALAGKREALNFIPFSDTLGITDPAETITGRDALEAAGILGPNEEGLDWGDAAGFLFELPTDPLAFVGGIGAAGKLAKGASAADKIAGASRLAMKTPIGRGKEIAEGTASLVRFATPDIGIPFTKYKLPQKELGSISGEKAAKVYDWINYDKYSPVPHIRKMFSGDEFTHQQPIGAQKFIHTQKEINDLVGPKGFDDVVEITKLRSNVIKAHEKLRTEAVFGGDPGVNLKKAQMVDEYAKTDKQFMKTLNDRLQNLATSDEAAKGLPQVDDAADAIKAQLFDETQDATKGFGNLGNELARRLTSLREASTEGMQNAPSTEQHWFSDAIGSLFEANPTTGMKADDYAEMLRTAGGYSDELSSFKQAQEALEALDSHVRTKLPAMRQKLVEIGVDIGKFTDPNLNYAPRSATRNYASDGYDIMGARSGTIGKTSRLVVNKLARLLAGSSRDAKYSEELAKTADLNRLDGTRVIKEPSKNSPTRALWEAAQKEGVDYADALEHAQNVRSTELETRQAMRDIYIESAEGNLGTNWMTVIARARKTSGANFDPTSIKGFDEVIQSVSNRLGKPADADLAEDVWQKLSHQNPVSRFNPRKLSEKSLIDESIYAATKNKDARAQQMLDDGVDSFDFGDNAATPISKPKKLTDDFAAQILVREGFKWNGNFSENMRQALSKHTDQDFASLAKSDMLDDDAFKEALFNNAKQRGLFPDAEDADDILEAMHNGDDPLLKGQGGQSWEELKQTAKWFMDLPAEVRKNGFFDRDPVLDVIDYLDQANKKIAQVSIVRAALKNPEFVGKIGENGNTVSLYDVWKQAGMTDDGLLNLVAETKGIDLQKRLDELESIIKNPKSAPDAKQAAFKDMNALKASLFDAARQQGVNSGMARGIINSGKVFAGKNEPSWLGKLADRLQAVLQAGLYVPWLASHNRNHIGGIAINAIGGAFDAKSYADAYKLFRGQNLNDDFIRNIVAEAVASGLLKASHPAGIDANKVLEDLQQAIDNPGSFVAGQGLVASLADPLKVMAGQVKDTYKAKGIKAAAKQALFGGTTIDGIPATGALNFWQVRGGIDPGGLKTNKNAVDSNGNPLGFLDKIKSAETRNVAMQIGEQAGAYTEFINRMQAYIYLRRQGWQPQAASLKVKELHFDYGDLNSFEKRVLKRNVLFYSFMRKNLELQAKLLIGQPGGTTSRIVKAENRIQDEAQGKEGFTPAHLREGFSVRLPGEVEGFPGVSRYWSQTGLLPIEEAAGRFQFDRNGFPLSIRRTAEKFASQLAPWFSAPIEQFSGRQLATGRNLKDLYKYPSGDPDIDFWLQKTPFARAISTVRTLSDERKGLPQKLFNLGIGGARVTDVNVPLTKMLEGRRAVQENLSADPDIGQYEALYAKDVKALMERAKNGDDQALMQLQLYQQLRNSIRDIRKEQDKKPKK